ACHHGRVRRVVLLASAVEAGGAHEDGSDRDRPAAHGGGGGAAVAPGMDFRAALGCVAAGGGHAFVLFCVALALVRVAGGGSAADLAVVLPGAGRAPLPDGTGACGGATGVLWRVPVDGGVNNPAARRLERLRPLEPMRFLHLVYLLFVLLAGGLLGQYVLKKHALRWLLLFVPLSAGMFYAQRQTYPATSHLELPGA